MVALLATACGSGGDDDKSSSSNGPVELTLQDHQKPRVELLRKLLPQFEQAMKAQGKQITVKLIEGPAEDGAFKSKLTLDYNSGNAPDVTSIGAADASSFAAVRVATRRGSMGSFVCIRFQYRRGSARPVRARADPPSVVSRSPPFCGCVGRVAPTSSVARTVARSAP